MTVGVFVETEVIESIEPLVIGNNAKWLCPLVRRLADCLGQRRRLTRRAVVTAIGRDESFHLAWQEGQVEVDESEAFSTQGPQMAAAHGPPSEWPGAEGPNPSGIGFGVAHSRG